MALTGHSPVTQVFMPQQRRIEGSSLGAFPPRDEMGEVMLYNFQSRRCPSLGVQGLEILLNRGMHALSSLACDRPSLLFYHSHTDSATCEHKEEAAQILHLLRHVGAFLNQNASEKETSPARGPSVRESFCSHRCAFQSNWVLPLKMVDNSTSPFQTHFGPVFG